jgi:predicted RNA-binding Zn-ribbon protein involved in translation (DUF1610 family)
MMKRKPRTFQCPKCSMTRTEPLASSVMHPCPKNGKKITEFKEIHTDDAVS